MTRPPFRLRAPLRSRRAAAALAAGCIAAAASSCFSRGYPLAEGGLVDVRLDSTTPLFAADVLDAAGKASGPRQRPTSTGVSLAITEDGEPANGAFVQVRVSPPEALTLRPATGEAGDEPTCEARDGAFRCTASREGIARFFVEAETDWSGQAKLFVGWAGQETSIDVEILPAGLPADATNFSLILGGLDATTRVLPTFLALQCSVDAVPENLGSKWRAGAIRAREAFVRATPPATAPIVAENAPVVVESLSSEGALSLDESCEKRETRLRLLLASTGQSQKFFVCFSDLGGAIQFAATSGKQALTREIAVDAEPRILRVLARVPEVEAGTPANVFEVSAYNSDRARIAMPVDLRVSDNDVMTIGENLTTTLTAEGDAATLVQVVPRNKGTAFLMVSPRLLSKPACESPAVRVVDAAPVAPQ